MLTHSPTPLILAQLHVVIAKKKKKKIGWSTSLDALGVEIVVRGAGRALGACRGASVHRPSTGKQI